MSYILSIQSTMGQHRHLDQEGNKGFVTPNDQRCWYPTGYPTESFKPVNQLQHLRKSGCSDIRAEIFCLNFILQFYSL